MRFPLIAGVVALHTFVSPEVFDTGGVMIGMPIYNTLACLLVGGLFSAAVPTFFFISGFLFFYKAGSFNSGIYLRKLRSRLRTLFIPFVFWNLLSCALIYLSCKVPIIDKILHLNTIEMPNGVIDFFIAPVEGQFWFIRDLMVLVVFSPIINWVVTRNKYAGITTIFLLWLAFFRLSQAQHQDYYISILNPLLFFAAGAWCARYKENIEWIAKGMKLFIAIWLIFVVALFILPDNIISLQMLDILRGIGNIFGVASLLSFAVYACQRWKFNGAGLLASSSFFVFAVHSHYVQKPLRIILCKIINPVSDVEYSITYLLLIVLTLVISVLIYKILSLISPSLLKVISGGRIHNCSSNVNKL